MAYDDQMMVADGSQSEATLESFNKSVGIKSKSVNNTSNGYADTGININNFICANSYNTDDIVCITKIVNGKARVYPRSISDLSQNVTNTNIKLQIWYVT